MKMYIQSFIHDPQATTSNEDTFLRDFLKILKQLLQNFKKILFSSVLVRSISLSLNTSLQRTFQRTDEFTFFRSIDRYQTYKTSSTCMSVSTDPFATGNTSVCRWRFETKQISRRHVVPRTHVFKVE